VPPPFLFVAGMVTIPAFLLQKRIDIRAVQVAAFLVLVLFAGSPRRGRLLWTVIVLLGSTLLLNLLTPFGRVLAKWGPLTVTGGALASGLGKGLTLVGLMLLSRLAVRRSVVLPGALGLYVSTSLSYLNQLLEERPRISGRGVLSRLDELFDSVFQREWEREPQERSRPRVLGILAAAAFVVANWGLVIFPG
jgi:hypothetical protein